MHVESITFTCTRASLAGVTPCKKTVTLAPGCGCTNMTIGQRPCPVHNPTALDGTPFFDKPLPRRRKLRWRWPWTWEER
jgi:hypothetical protein